MSESNTKSLLSKEESQKIYCHYQEPTAVQKLSSRFAQLLLQINPGLIRPVVVVGIGTDRCTGDCLGPLVGTNLLEMGDVKPIVYGTLEDPIHANNLKKKIEDIKSRHFKPLIVAVDASLGRSTSIGKITLAPGALKPGAGVNKQLPEVGDIHFTGIINVGGFMEYFVLQNTRLSLVMKMAQKISLSIYYGYKKALSYKKDSQGDMLW
ncbi:MAG: spore protease YyaC [Clostridia bacterium]|nr:spore protease YyaC [Clostridia bacterium]